MNVLQVVQHLKTGGLEKVVLDLVRNSYYKRSTYVVALEGTKEEALLLFPELSQLGDRLYCLNKQPGWRFEIGRKLARICRANHINVVHSHHIGPLIYTAMSQLGNWRMRHIHTIHDAWFLNTPRYRKLFKFITSCTPVELVADANMVSQDVHTLSGIAVNNTILNGIDTSVFKPGSKRAARAKLTLPENQLLIGCAARLEPGKGHEKLLRALAKLPVNVSLVLAGDGSLRSSLERLSHTLGLARRVHWLGNCHDMPTFYHAIDSFCLFSEREGLPLTLMEAIASGRPVVATDVGGVSEIVTREFGLLLGPTNTRALPGALMESLRWKINNDVSNKARLQIDVKTMCAHYDNLFTQSSISGVLS